MIIGYTTGVFDMFHIGHLNVLQKAKSMCDYLIVGVSTDELVQKEKNKIPVIPYSERVEIIRALRCVDEVVPQLNKNKLEAWEKYKYHRMFVGSDWKGTPAWIRIEEDLRPHGVEVVYFDYTSGVSSTILRDRLMELCGD